MREIVLDTETTGLDPKTGDRILEIAAIEIFNQAPTGAHYHVLINPERDVPEGAVKVHGHTADSLKDKPVFAHVVEEFLAFIGKDMLVIHNADFDVAFLDAELLRTGREPIGKHRVLDTLAVARKKHPGASNSLDALCDRYRIDRSKRVRHGALLDCELLVEIYIELSGGRQRSFTLAAPARMAGGVTSLARKLERPSALPSRFDEADASRHLAHIERYGETAIWRKFGYVG